MTETGEDNHHATATETHNDSADAAAAPSRDGRAAFIRQASLPLLSKESDPDAQPTAIDPPPLHVRWLHAQETGKSWESFSVKDSRRLEAAWAQWKQTDSSHEDGDQDKKEEQDDTDSKDKEWTPINPDEETPLHKVPVTRDMLYNADLKQMNMSPVFWKGPSLEITRASWFFESNKLSPCTAQLADELEQQFQTIRPWLPSYLDELKSSVSLGAEAEDKLKCHLKSIANSYVIFQGPRLARLYTKDFSARLSKQFFTAWSGEHGGGQLLVRGYHTLQQLTQAKKAGTTYKQQIAKRAAESLSKRQSIASTASDKSKKAVQPTAQSADPDQLPEQISEALKDSIETSKDDKDDHSTENAPPQIDTDLKDKPSNSTRVDSPVPETAQGSPSVDVSKTTASAASAPSETKRLNAGAQLKNLVATASQRSSAIQKNELFRAMASRFGVWNDNDPGSGSLTPKQQEDISASLEEARRKVQDLPQEHEQEDEVSSVQDDPEAFDDDEDARESEEYRDEPPQLVFAIHGIGQRLAGEWKSFDFVAAMNTFRELVQQRTSTARPPADIGGSGLRGIADGRRIQIVPVFWRAGFHIEEQEREKDVGQKLDDEEDPNFDNGAELEMDHIFGDEGIPIVRTLTREVLMDIPMYMSHHRQNIHDGVIREANRLYRLFVQRNANFEERGGKVHLIAHSLGSAIATHILSEQPTKVELVKNLSREQLQEVGVKHFIFNVDKYFTVGSPVGMFFVLHRAQLIARKGRESNVPSSASVVSLDEPGKYGCLAVSGFYNVWNQFDPVSTRCTPCVDVKFAKTIKPLPMSKAIRAVYRTDEDAIAPEAAKDKRETTDSKRQSGGGTGSRPSSMFFGSWGRKEGAAAAAAAAKKEEEAEVEKDKKVNGEEDEAESMKKRIEAKAREEEQKEKERKEEEDRLKSQEELDPRRRERAEARLAALNPMGRVDFYMPLEGYSLLNSINQYTQLITAHMSYWNRADFADFLITQLLADPERLRKSATFREVEGWD